MSMPVVVGGGMSTSVSPHARTPTTTSLPLPCNNQVFRYYAVRRGRHGHVHNCIFLSWKDAAPHIHINMEGTRTGVVVDHHDDSGNVNGNHDDDNVDCIWQGFDNLDEADQYLRTMDLDGGGVIAAAASGTGTEMGKEIGREIGAVQVQIDTATTATAITTTMYDNPRILTNHHDSHDGNGNGDATTTSVACHHENDLDVTVTVNDVAVNHHHHQMPPFPPMMPLPLPEPTPVAGFLHQQETTTVTATATAARQRDFENVDHTTLGNIHMTDTGTENDNDNGNISGSYEDGIGNGVARRNKSASSSTIRKRGSSSSRKLSKNWLNMRDAFRRHRDRTGSFAFQSNYHQQYQLGKQSQSDNAQAQQHVLQTKKEYETLKRWVNEQKHQYKCLKLGKKTYMTHEKIRLLADIGYHFDFESWGVRMKQLREYRDTVMNYVSLQATSTSSRAVGDGTVSGSSSSSSSSSGQEEHGSQSSRSILPLEVPADHPTLGPWMQVIQRQLYFHAQGEKSTLTDENVQELRSLGVTADNDTGQGGVGEGHRKMDVHKGLSSTSKMESRESRVQWNQMYAALQRFHAKHGHCNVVKPDSDTNNGSTHSRNDSTAESANVHFNTNNSFHEHTLLFEWVCKQRLQYRKLKNGQPNKMSAERMQKLHDLGFKFFHRPAYTKWSDRMEQLRQYKAHHGHLNIPVKDPELGEFVSRTRMEYNKYFARKETGMDGGHETMTPATTKKRKKVGMNEERARELEELGFVFHTGKRRTLENRARPNKPWEERFEEFLAFKNEYGHCLVPQQNSGLGEWVHRQRKHYKMLKKGKACPMTAERALKLTEAGFIFDATKYRRSRKLESEASVAVEEQQQRQQQQDHQRQQLTTTTIW